MQINAEQIAAIINGKIEGNGGVTVSDFGKIEEALPGQLSFLANPKYEDYLYTTQASVIIVNESLILKKPISATLIRVPDAYSSFAQLLTAYQEMMSKQLQGIQDQTFISATATLGANLYVGQFSYIGEHVVIGHNTKIHPQVYIGNDVEVGENTILHAGVKIYPGCKIGSNVVIHAGTIIGSDGFGFAPQPDGTYKKIPQIGNVVIEENVEIGANCTIDRATIGSTIIRKGAKLDNLIQIAHNVEIGSYTVIAAQTGISGSTKIGKHVQIAGQAGLAGHISIEDGVKIGGQSGVTKSLKKGEAVTGTPAFNYTSALRIQAVSRNLPELEKRIKELEQKIALLTK
ncbi:MAG: UDP-3-O-(3-hydroxymyristoyl)glucosamine N-acyltransferase [Sphingobacteriales bacterium]|jgi:UDP-3-O-[3-hydroxymyristoyl] glucosamine N-acyltransferase